MTTNPVHDYQQKSKVNANPTPSPGANSDTIRPENEAYNPERDQRDMRRLGKRQELKVRSCKCRIAFVNTDWFPQRRFRFFSIVGYIIVLGLTWEFSIVTSVFSLANGGTAGAIWLVLVVTFGMFTVMLSMAEMASMAPTSGGQYHWVSEFAPAKYQKQLSYAVGWLVTLGWQSAMPTVAYVGAQQTLALISICQSGKCVGGSTSVAHADEITRFCYQRLAWRLTHHRLRIGCNPLQHIRYWKNADSRRSRRSPARLRLLCFPRHLLGNGPSCTSRKNVHNIRRRQ